MKIMEGQLCSSDVNEICEASDMDDSHEGGDDCFSENLSWADAMSKVLGSLTSKNKNFILSKAKKDRAIKWKKEEPQCEPVELVDGLGNLSKQAESDKGTKRKVSEMVNFSEKQRKKYLWENMCRIKPDIATKEKERTLVRIATKGVVQLFNAVEKIQTAKGTKNENLSSPEKKAGKLVKDKSFTKGQFLDMLKTSKTDCRGENGVHNSVQEQPTWSVLKDDFMMGGTMKDWDKDSEND